MRLLCLVLAIQTVVAAPLPRYLQQAGKPLTAPSGQAPVAIAEAFTVAQMQAAGLSTGQSLYLAREYRTESNGVTHVAYRQRFQGLEVYQSEWVVNVDANGQVISAGGNLYPAPAGAAPDFGPVLPAAQVALAAVGVRSEAEPPVAGRAMVSIGGDPAASRTGWVRGGGTPYPLSTTLFD